MRPIIKLAFIVLSVSYPFLIYWGIKTQHQQLPLILLTILLASRLWLVEKWLDRIISIGLFIFLGFIILISKPQSGLMFYPVIINVMLLYTFATSLISGTPVIERIARLKEPNLPSRAITYTRNVTKAWCVFFVINASISTWTALLTTPKIWLWYNGIISYILIACMLSIEWLIRLRIKRQ